MSLEKNSQHDEQKQQLTPGELLAQKLKGDTNVTNNDIANATNKFFEENGIQTNAKVETIMKD